MRRHAALGMVTYRRSTDENERTGGMVVGHFTSATRLQPGDRYRPARRRSHAHLHGGRRPYRPLRRDLRYGAALEL